MPVLYGPPGSQFSLSPAPLVGVSRQNLTAPDGSFLGQTYQLTLTGTLVTTPPGSGYVQEPARLGVLLAKQDQLTQVFSVSGQTFEVYSPDGTNVVKCNPRVVSIDFTSGIWVDKTEYTIVLESNSLYPGDTLPGEAVEDIKDEWQIEEVGAAVDSDGSIKPVWQITHNVSATGKLSYDENGTLLETWKSARDYVLNRLETSNFSGKPFDTSNELNLPAGAAGYNHKRTEEVDVANGSFSITEVWILALGVNATEEYTISISKNPEESVDCSVKISGTIRGLTDESVINELDGRMTNAISYFNSSVKDNLIVRARAAVPEVTLSDYGVNGSLDYGYADGTINYAYEFSDRVTPDGNDEVYDNYVISRKSSQDSAEITVTVSGTITGRLRITEATGAYLLKYNRAKSYFDSLIAGSEILNRAALYSGVSNLQSAPSDDNIDFNLFEGIITYSFDFSNRLNNLVKNDYTVSFETGREDGKTTVSVQGTVVGYRQNDTDSYLAKYNNALSFYNGFVLTIPNIAFSYSKGANLNPIPLGQTEGYSQTQGTISYDYKYNTDPITSITNALSQQITINDTEPTDVFAAITVLGRIQGPVLQSIGSKKERSRTVTLDVTMKPGSNQPTDEADALIDSYMPDAQTIFLDRNEVTWSPSTFHFSQSKTWVYE